MHNIVSIETERLLLREWRDADLHPFAKMNADRRVMEFYPNPLTQAESDEIVGRIREQFAEQGFGLWAVEIRDGAPFAGFIGLARPRFEAHFTPCVEIGWRLVADFWGEGFATEGARAVLDFAFERLNLNEVVSMTSLVNLRSRRVMEKLGMSYDAEDDFDHPMVDAGHVLCRHVLYRKRSSS